MAEQSETAKAFNQLWGALTTILSKIQTAIQSLAWIAIWVLVVVSLAALYGITVSIIPAVPFEKLLYAAGVIFLLSGRIKLG